ncbi:putative DNA or RNA helicase of superfamily II [Herminiimonas arsenicoxydans]|uniref:DNA or RNA helicase of superfamily II n=1 Tax=Herminiimonas arsenicoxydans TaxID=204773 RepID=A4G305_HERAR|nr:putative DNA or RNA helicase of superfamily II [Herminiimonas arsenicoxydans]
MKLELKDFQEDAVEQLIKKLNPAKREVADGGDHQAVILAAPTGSGKTVITAALIEEILSGSDRFTAEPDAVFLWLSDQPVLNEQSKRRVASASTKLGNGDLIVVDADFDSETFVGGKVYFINTQKLGKDKLLTSGQGDKRTFTIWETISNTAKAKADRFYLIIDEAHRGTKVSRTDESTRLTVMQKFVKGSEGEIPAIDLILGVSATPQRFQQLIDGQSNRTPRKCEINPLDVRASGLLKDRIMVFHPSEAFPTDTTMLRAAVQQWRTMGVQWHEYAQTQGLPTVHPALIIQVQDGSSDGVSRTNLDEVIATIEKETGPIDPSEIAHCFEHDAAISANGVLIRKIDASRIQEETNIKFVLFKMALTTGWDCPRAEVMMSFRTAQDDTLIAQLIGRMVRTPLARRIEGSEVLNSVSLYLPHYDKEGLTRVVNHLKQGDPMELPPTDVEDGAKMVTFKRSASMDAAFDALTGLPTYRVERVRKVSNTRRLMALSRLLTTMHEVDMTAWDDSKQLVINTLDTELARLKKNSPDFDAKVKGSGQITLNAVIVEQGTWKEIQGQTLTVPLDEKNIDDLFNRAGQRLGEGLHLDFWQTHYDQDELDEMPSRSRLELFLMLQDEKTWKTLEAACGERCETLLSQNKAAIKKLTTAEQEDYNKVQEVAKEPEALSFLPPVEMMLAVDIKDSNFRNYDGHMYVDASGHFVDVLNNWEHPVIEAEIVRADVVGWLRNVPRKPWAFSLPYEFGGENRPMYPDFLVVRAVDDDHIVDILEPHSPALADSYAKAKGLAQFAAKHAMHFGRIELIRVVGKEIKRLDLIDATNRKRVLAVDSNAGLDLVFGVAKE